MKQILTTSLAIIVSISLIFGAFTVSALNETVTQSDIVNGLTHYYTFDDPAAPGKNTITVYGDAIAKNGASTAGNTSQAVSDRTGGYAIFDGTDDYFELPADVFDNLDNGITMSAWVNFDRLADWMRIWDIGTSDRTSFFSLEVLWGSKLTGEITNQGQKINTWQALQGNLNLEPDNTTVSANTWVHVAVSSAPDKTAKMYLNGTCVQTRAAQGSDLTKMMVCAASDIQSPSIRLLGRSLFNASNPSAFNDPYFQGKMDNVMIHNRVLSEAEVQYLYHSKTTISTETLIQGDAVTQYNIAKGLTHYYTFNDQTTPGKNSIANYGDATAENGAATGTSQSVSEETGGYATFDGADDYFELPADVFDNLDDGITMSAWVNFDRLADWMRIWDIGTSDRTSFFSLGILWGSKLTGEITNQGQKFNTWQALQGNLNLEPDNTTMPTNTWVHVAVSSAPDKTAKMYINGTCVQVRAAQGSDLTKMMVCAASDIQSPSIRLLGRSLFNASNPSAFNDPYFQGKMDNVMIHNRVLSEAEVQYLYHSKSTISTEWLNLDADVLNVKGAIQAIGQVTPGSGKALFAAKAAFNALTSSQKEQVDSEALAAALTEFETFCPNVYGATIRASGAQGLRFGTRITVTDSASTGYKLVGYGTVLIAANKYKGDKLVKGTPGSVYRQGSVLNADSTDIEYGVTIVNIPSNHYLTDILARSYLVYENLATGEQVTVYNTSGTDGDASNAFICNIQEIATKWGMTLT